MFEDPTAGQDIGAKFLQGFNLASENSAQKEQANYHQQELAQHERTFSLEQQKLAQQQAVMQLGSEAAKSGDPVAIARYTALHPEGGKALSDLHKTFTDEAQGLLQGINQAKITDRPAIYKMNVERLSKLPGFDTSNYPAEYDPSLADPIINNDLTATRDRSKSYQVGEQGIFDPTSGKLTPTEGSDLEIQKKRADIAKLGKEKLTAGEKPPAGYRFTTGGDLEAIPGGPAAKLSAESAGKVALIKQGENDINRFQKLITDSDGSFNRTKIAALNTWGTPGTRTENSTLFNAVNARLRLESGAAVPEAEVKRAMKTFAPSTFDSDETITSKIERMKEFFGLAKDEIGQGRGAKPTSGKTSESDPLGLFNK